MIVSPMTREPTAARRQTEGTAIHVVDHGTDLRLGVFVVGSTAPTARSATTGMIAVQHRRSLTGPGAGREVLAGHDGEEHDAGACARWPAGLRPAPPSSAQAAAQDRVDRMRSSTR